MIGKSVRFTKTKNLRKKNFNFNVCNSLTFNRALFTRFFFVWILFFCFVFLFFFNCISLIFLVIRFSLTLWHTVDSVRTTTKRLWRSEKNKNCVLYGSLCGSECVDESIAKMRMKAKLYFIVVFTYDSFWLKIFDRVTFTPYDWCTMMSCYVNNARWLVARYLQWDCIGGRARVYVLVNVYMWILC